MDSHSVHITSCCNERKWGAQLCLCAKNQCPTDARAKSNSRTCVSVLLVIVREAQDCFSSLFSFIFTLSRTLDYFVWLHQSCRRQLLIEISYSSILTMKTVCPQHRLRTLRTKFLTTIQITIDLRERDIPSMKFQNQGNQPTENHNDSVFPHFFHFFLMQGVEKAQADFSGVIELNVGGVCYATSRETLCKVFRLVTVYPRIYLKFPGSMLAAMFSGKFSLQKDRKGRYFIDRDGEGSITHFYALVNLKLLVSSWISWEQTVFTWTIWIEYCSSIPLR